MVGLYLSTVVLIINWRDNQKANYYFLKSLVYASLEKYSQGTFYSMAKMFMALHPWQIAMGFW